ncbi:uncharacterized protein [Euphorbia lathyris]|uniref:uncharacterized protein n=1 Tax=Euphorbia lathyris TaxID=212925 RepID=UPI0033133DE5
MSTMDSFLTRDPLEQIIADGRILMGPINQYVRPEIITINLDVLHTNIGDHLKLVFQDNIFVRGFYNLDPTSNIIDIHADVNSLCDYLIGVTYNHLRFTLEMTCPTELVSRRMHNRCPVSDDLEFPAFISETLSLIGPCRPFDKLIVFAPAANTATNYGRAVPVTFNYYRYSRFISILKDSNYLVASLHFITGVLGSFFPLTEFRPLSDGVFSLHGTVHSSHYEQEDIVRIALCCSRDGVSPFEKTGMTIGYVDDETVLNALDAVAAPENIPQDSMDLSCGAAPSPVQDKISKANASSIFDPCFWTSCGGGSCSKTFPFTYSCGCTQGYYNLLNMSVFPCFKECAIGMDCANQVKF